jgi:GDP-D-mannose dehydratase
LNAPRTQNLRCRPQGYGGFGHRRHLLTYGVQSNQTIIRTHAELYLTNQAALQAFFAQEKLDHDYLAAAKVGGIHANNTYPAEFIYDNLIMQVNVIDAVFKNGVKKLLFLGSSCISPKLAPQPMREDALLTGTLESTNEPYAIAKIAGIKLCESYNRQYGASHGVDYRSVMPTNLCGPGDSLVQETLQSETTPFYPRSPYAVPSTSAVYSGLSKLSACTTVTKVHAAAKLLSPAKSPAAWPTLLRDLKSAFFYMGNLDALRDWGHAKYYLRMQWKMLQQDQPENFVIATGLKNSVRQTILWNAKKINNNTKNCRTGRG